MRRIVLICLSLFLAPLFPLALFAEPVEYAQKVTVSSEIFETERTLRVALPESYSSGTSAVYPVIYVVRGQSDTLSMVASLDMLDNEVPEFIVVGIDGEVGDFFPSKDGDQTNYSRFVHTEVIPYINTAYRTAPYSVLAGHSMASIYVAAEWFERGTEFSKYILISPPLNNGRMNKDAMALGPKSINAKNPILVTIGNEGDQADAGFNDFKATLSKYNTATFKRFPDQTHMSTRIVSMLHGLRDEFKTWKPSKKVQDGSLDGLIQHYDGLSKQYGFLVDIPLDMLERMSGFGSWTEDKEKNANAIAAVKYVLARNSKDIDRLFNVTEQLVGFGNMEASARLKSYICAQAKQEPRCTEG